MALRRTGESEQANVTEKSGEHSATRLGLGRLTENQ